MGLIVLNADEWTAVAALRSNHDDALGLSVEWSPRTDRVIATVELPDGVLRDYEIDGTDAEFTGQWQKVEAAA